MKSTKKMFTYRVEKEQHETLKALAKQLNKQKALKFPIVTSSQLAKIEEIEYASTSVFNGFSKTEAEQFIKNNS